MKNRVLTLSIAALMVNSPMQIAFAGFEVIAPSATQDRAIAVGASDQKVGQYNFSYLASGELSATLVQVFDDGKSTFFQFRAGDAIPAVFGNKDGKTVLLAPIPEGPYIRVNGVGASFTLQLGRAQAQVVYSAGGRSGVPATDVVKAKPAETRATPPTQAVPDHYTVPFTKDHAPLDVASRAVLNTLIPQMRNEYIRIIGRPDAMLYSTGKMSTIARNRAINIRDYLTRHGVPASRIVIETDNSPNPQLDGNSYPCDIYITNTDSRASAPSPANASSNYAQPEVYKSERYEAARAYAASAQPAYYAPAPVIAAPASPAPQARDQQLIQYINQAVQSGQMQPTVALKLLRSLMESESNNVPQQTVAQSTTPQLRAPAPEPVPLFVAAPAVIRNETWVLDKKLTLRDNLDAWSKTAGWNPSVWNASNFYQVTATSTIEGGFPDILRKIADSTGLNICARTREKIVRVTDATVSCK